MLNKAGRGYFPADQSWHTLCFYHKYPKKIRDVQEAPKLKEGAGNSLPFFFNYLKNIIFSIRYRKKYPQKAKHFVPEMLHGVEQGEASPRCWSKHTSLKMTSSCGGVNAASQT